MTPTPVCFFGCQSARCAPSGSRQTTMRPMSKTSNGSDISVPPSSLALAALASALSTQTYDSQAGGTSLFWYIAAASRPPIWPMTYGGWSGPIGISFGSQPKRPQ